MKSLPVWKQLPQAVFDLLFPPSCAACGKGGDSLCASCRSQLPRLEGRLCPWCSRAIGDSGVCQPCKVRPLSVEIRAPFQFNGAVRQAIYSLKYRNNRALAGPLADLLFDYWRDRHLCGDVLAPVPLHRSRLRHRGYNQSELLARELGQRVGIPVIATALVRTHNTPPQAQSSSAEERWANASGAFLCTGRDLQGKAVVLVDDVCTTGATMNSAARAVLSAGAASVRGLTIAREM